MVKFKDENGNCIFKLTNQKGILKPTVEVGDVQTS